MKFRSGNTHQNKKKLVGISKASPDWPKHGEEVQSHCCAEKIQGAN